MRGLPSKIMAGISVSIVVFALAFGYFAKTAGSAIPRSHALNGAAQSGGAIPIYCFLALIHVVLMMDRIFLASS
jgi:hypothetical protein